jgi:hypothetical protein
MKYSITGRLCGFFCDDCQEDLSGVVLRLYRLPEGTTSTGPIAADPKETLQILDEAALEKRANALLAETRTDEQGKFVFDLDPEKIGYKGEAVELVAVCKTVPGLETPKAHQKPVSFSITFWQPMWRQSPDGFFAHFEYCLPAKFWCFVRGLFDAWVICGRVVVCDKPGQGVGGVEVTACDADWIQDDKLGTAMTDASGHFRIDFPGSKFRKNFLIPLNIDTPFPFNSGPDVYFIVKSGSLELLKETRADGNKPGRANIGNCFCVTLCVDVPGTVDTPAIPGVWTGIGTAFTIPDASSNNDFDTNGYAGAGKFGLFDTIRFTGSAPHRQNGNPVEYRFRISEVTAPNGAAPVAEANFTKTVGVDAGLFVETKVCQMVRFAPFKIVDVIAKEVDLDPQGWLDINTSIFRTFVDRPDLNETELGTPGLWNFADTDGLMALDTTAFAPAVVLPDADAGVPVPPANRLVSLKKIAVRFEIREVINKAANLFAAMPGSGWVVNSIIVNNHQPYGKIAMASHLVSGFCGALSGDVKMAYTAYHPLISAVSLNLRSNDLSYNRNLQDPAVGAPVMPVSGNTNDAVNHFNNNNLAINGNTGAGGQLLHTCTYIATLNITPRLHTGDSGYGTATPQTSFYYQV